MRTPKGDAAVGAAANPAARSRRSASSLVAPRSVLTRRSTPPPCRAGRADSGGVGRARPSCRAARRQSATRGRLVGRARLGEHEPERRRLVRRRTLGHARGGGVEEAAVVVAAVGELDGGRDEAANLAAQPAVAHQVDARHKIAGARAHRPRRRVAHEHPRLLARGHAAAERGVVARHAVAERSQQRVEPRRLVDRRRLGLRGQKVGVPPPRRRIRRVVAAAHAARADEAELGRGERVAQRIRVQRRRRVERDELTRRRDAGVGAAGAREAQL